MRHRHTAMPNGRKALSRMQGSAAAQDFDTALYAAGIGG
jgi:hypothetical protein